jgi:hypothetical protein
MENLETKQNITIKLIFFYLFLFVDLIFSSFIETHIGNNSATANQNSTIPIIVI